jgi:predicted phage gp36 major capsid-like protein
MSIVSEINKQKEQRAKLVADARDFVEQIEKSGRTQTPEDEAKFRTMLDDAEKIGEKVADLERLAALERSALAEPGKTEPIGTPAPEKKATEPSAEAHSRAYNAWLRGGEAEFNKEVRGLQADNDTLGGYLKPPPQFVASLIKAVEVSRKLLRVSAIPAEALVRDRLAYKFARTQENSFLNGSGANQPLGVFTASTLGISTGRDVSTGNTTTAIGADNLKEVKYTLKSQYWPGASWIFHRDAVKQIAKLKDGEGRYMWQPSIVAGQPDMLESFPVRISELAPNTFTTGLYVGILGNFKVGYWIADLMSLELDRLNELYRGSGQVGFIGTMWADGMPVLEEAFVRVKLA